MRIESKFIDKVVQHLKKTSDLDDRVCRNLIEANLLSGDEILLLEQKNSTKGIHKNLSFKKCLQTMIFQKWSTVPQ